MPPHILAMQALNWAATVCSKCVCTSVCMHVCVSFMCYELIALGADLEILLTGFQNNYIELKMLKRDYVTCFIKF